jgi:transposase-like protein
MVTHVLKMFLLLDDSEAIATGFLGTAVIVERAQAAGPDASTLYRWARAYRASGLLSSLLPYKPGFGEQRNRKGT